MIQFPADVGQLCYQLMKKICELLVTKTPWDQGWLCVFAMYKHLAPKDARERGSLGKKIQDYF